LLAISLQESQFIYRRQIGGGPGSLGDGEGLELSSNIEQ
jgi:hypothetical protein